MENDTRPLLVIPDSHERVRCWRYLKTLPYWRGGIALCSKTTPPEHVGYLDARGIVRITVGTRTLTCAPRWLNFMTTTP